LSIHHDEDAEVYINGQLIRKFSNYVGSYGLGVEAALTPVRSQAAPSWSQVVPLIDLHTAPQAAQSGAIP
jgi:hypothetical protein